jgi:hypothetical protein
MSGLRRVRLAFASLCMVVPIENADWHCWEVTDEFEVSELFIEDA